MNGIVPRPATARDIAGITVCVYEAYRRYIERIGKSPGPMLDDYKRIVAEHRTYVIEDHEAIIGVLVLKESESGVLLDNVAVHPSCQGRGLGCILVAFAESEARSLNHARLELYTHQLMTGNIEWYKRLGYEETKRVREDGFARIYMSKHL